LTVSALYLGHVAHRRLRPKRHALRYGVFQLYLDLDEAAELSGTRRLFGFNRPALLSFWEADHGDGGKRPLADQMRARAKRAGFDASGPVRVLAMPRVLGFVFNPITLYFCYDAGGRVSAVIHEVNNTVGGRCFYVLGAGGEGPIRQHAQKRMYVSPFMDMDYSYDFALAEPGETFALGLQVKRGEAVWLTASFAGKRRPFTDRSLLAAWLRHPLLTVKVVAGIHFEALRIWLKGIAWRPPVSEPARRGDQPSSTSA
jgi:DUF1365 family protein